MMDITQEGRRMLENPCLLYDNYTALQIVLLGIVPPKWKKRYKTRKEALMACRELLEKEFGIKQFKEEEDYTKWK